MSDALRLAAGLVREFEGCRLHPYADSKGAWTIGYGSTVMADGKRVTAATPPITEAQAEALMTASLSALLVFLRVAVKVALNDHETAALLSFTYNVGRRAFLGSTLLALLNAGKRAAAAAEFPKWCHAGNPILPGLVRRRAAERAMFETVEKGVQK